MNSVCVIGGGTAGIAAAKEASLRGAQVTVLERAPGWELPSRRWPDLVSGRSPPRCLSEVPCSLDSIDLRFGVEARSAVPGSVITASGETILADSIVVATGGFPDVPPFEGRRKPGVVILDRPEAYSELGERAGSISSAVVVGEGRRGLLVAERLGRPGRAVLQVITCWQDPAPSQPVFDVLRDAAARNGVGLSRGRFDRVLGAGRVEGAVVNGRVIPCDALVVVPPRRPRFSSVGARRGNGGGILVDLSLRSSARGILAAGMAAYLESADPPRTLHESPEASGTVAGANSAGGALAVGVVGCIGVGVFGLKWLQAGAAPWSRPSTGIGPTALGRRAGRDSACTLAYDGHSRVLGIETVEQAASLSNGLSAAISGHATLAGLAYGGPEPIDISVISDTARQGFRQWSRY